jgi:hypothetical protein
MMAGRRRRGARAVAKIDGGADEFGGKRHSVGSTNSGYVGRSKGGTCGTCGKSGRRSGWRRFFPLKIVGVATLGIFLGVSPPCRGEDMTWFPRETATPEMARAIASDFTSDFNSRHRGISEYSLVIGDGLRANRGAGAAK